MASGLCQSKHPVEINVKLRLSWDLIRAIVICSNQTNLVEEEQWAVAHGDGAKGAQWAELYGHLQSGSAWHEQNEVPPLKAVTTEEWHRLVWVRAVKRAADGLRWEEECRREMHIRSRLLAITVRAVGGGCSHPRKCKVVSVVRRHGALHSSTVCHLIYLCQSFGRPLCPRFRSYWAYWKFTIPRRFPLPPPNPIFGVTWLMRQRIFNISARSNAWMTILSSYVDVYFIWLLTKWIGTHMPSLLVVDWSFRVRDW